jgi:hypothetical protein
MTEQKKNAVAPFIADPESRVKTTARPTERPATK